MHQQLQDAISQQSSLQRENETLKKRNKALSEVVEEARADLRQHEAHVHAVNREAL
jgi:FtsZ-binding cell division protein ZapB